MSVGWGRSMMIQLCLAGFVDSHTPRSRRFLANQRGSTHSNNSQTKHPKVRLTGPCPRFNCRNKLREICESTRHCIEMCSACKGTGTGTAQTPRGWRQLLGYFCCLPIWPDQRHRSQESGLSSACCWGGQALLGSGRCTGKTHHLWLGHCSN